MPTRQPFCFADAWILLTTVLYLTFTRARAWVIRSEGLAIADAFADGDESGKLLVRLALLFFIAISVVTLGRHLAPRGLRWITSSSM